MAQPGATSSAGLAALARDVSIIAVLAVVAMIIIVVASVHLIVRYLRTAVDGVGGAVPPAECTAWLERRRRAWARPAGPPPAPGCEAYAARGPPPP